MRQMSALSVLHQKWCVKRSPVRGSAGNFSRAPILEFPYPACVISGWVRVARPVAPPSGPGARQIPLPQSSGVIRQGDVADDTGTRKCAGSKVVEYP